MKLSRQAKWAITGVAVAAAAVSAIVLYERSKLDSGTAAGGSGGSSGGGGGGGGGSAPQLPAPAVITRADTSKSVVVGQLIQVLLTPTAGSDTWYVTSSDPTVVAFNGQPGEALPLSGGNVNTTFPVLAVGLTTLQFVSRHNANGVSVDSFNVVVTATAPALVSSPVNIRVITGMAGA